MSVSAAPAACAGRPWIRRAGRCLAVALSLALVAEAAIPISVAKAEHRDGRWEQRRERMREMRREFREARHERREERRAAESGHPRELPQSEERIKELYGLGGRAAEGEAREILRQQEARRQQARERDGARRGSFDSDRRDDRHVRRQDGRHDGRRGDRHEGRRHDGRRHDGRRHDGHRHHGRRDREGSSGAVAAVLGVAAGAALLALLADRPNGHPPRRVYHAPPRPAPYRPSYRPPYHDPAPAYRRGHDVGAAPGSAIYALPGGGSGRLSDGYLWIAAGAFGSLDAAMDLALDLTANGVPAQVFRSHVGDYVVVIGAADEWSANDEVRRLVAQGRIPGETAFVTDGRGFQRRYWAAPAVLADERVAHGGPSGPDYR